MLHMDNTILVLSMSTSLECGKPKIAMQLWLDVPGYKDVELAGAHLPERQQMQDQQHLSFIL